MASFNLAHPVYPNIDLNVVTLCAQVLESVQELGRHPENTCYEDLSDDIENPSDSDDVDVDTISVHSTPKPKLM